MVCLKDGNIRFEFDSRGVCYEFAYACLAHRVPVSAGDQRQQSVLPLRQPEVLLGKKFHKIEARLVFIVHRSFTFSKEKSPTKVTFIGDFLKSFGRNFSFQEKSAFD